MLASHKIIDALRGNGGMSLEPVRGVTREHRLSAADIIEQAAKFDFGRLVLEKIEEGKYKIPEFTADELEFWTEGLIPLPYPCCWYECIIGETRSGFIAIEEDGNVYAERFDIMKANGQDSLLEDGIIIEIPRQARIGTDIYGSLRVLGNISLVDGASPETLAATNWQAHGPLIMYMTLMLNSRTTEKRSEQAPAKLNKKRMLHGKAPLDSHTVVSIVPQRFRQVEGQGGTHASPRLHWRRSHVRTLQSGKRILIARMLVGKAELGEVSHEYKVS